MKLPLFEFNVNDSVLKRVTQYLNDSIQQYNEAAVVLTNAGENMCEHAHEIQNSFQQFNDVVEKGSLAYYSSDLVHDSNKILDTISRAMVPACNQALASHVRERGTQNEAVDVALRVFEYPLKRLFYKPGFGIRLEKLSHRLEGASPQSTTREILDDIGNILDTNDFVHYDAMTTLTESLRAIVMTPKSFDWNHVAHIYSLFISQLKSVVDFLEKARFLEISGLSAYKTYDMAINLLYSATLEALETAQQMRQIVESSIELSILTQK